MSFFSEAQSILALIVSVGVLGVAYYLFPSERRREKRFNKKMIELKKRWLDAKRRASEHDSKNLSLKSIVDDLNERRSKEGSNNKKR